MASKEAFDFACVQLYSRLWAELEQVSATEHASGLRSPEQSSAAHIEVLRLELILLLDACDGVRWRMQLKTSQRLVLQSLLGDVLDALNAEANEGSRLAPIEWAQNRLFDALLTYGEVLSDAQYDRSADRLAS